MNGKVKISLERIEIILSLPTDLLEYMLSMSAIVSKCMEKKHDIEVIDNGDSYIFFISKDNEKIEEKCSREKVLFKLMI